MITTTKRIQPIDLHLSGSPEHSTNIPLEIYERARKLGSANALGMKRVGSFRWYSYNDVVRSVMGFSEGLLQMGLEPGDRVAILSKNRPNWVLADLGIQAARGVTVPFFETLQPRSIKFLLQDCEAKGIVLANDQQLKKVLPYLSELPHLKFVITLDRVLTATPTTLHLFSDVVTRGLRDARTETFEARLRSIHPDEVATIIYTSGTTSLPKGVMLTHRNILSNVRCARLLLPVEVGEVALSYLPLAHVMERMSHYFYLSQGVAVVHSRGTDRLMDELREVNPHFLVCVPRFFDKVMVSVTRSFESRFPFSRQIFASLIEMKKFPPVLNGYQNDGVLRWLNYQVVNGVADTLLLSRVRGLFGKNLRFFISGGAPLDPETGEFFEALGLPILEGYGLTETSPIISVNTLEERRYGTVGKPLPGQEVRIGELGEIQVKGPNIMKGYWRREQENAEAFTADGWFKTGDVGYLDNDGFLVITDRLKNLIVLSTGKNVSPAPIEELYKQSPYIHEVVLIGDNQKYITALILPEVDEIKRYASKTGLIYKDVPSLVKRQEIQHLIDQELKRLGDDLAPHERCKKFVLIHEDTFRPSGVVTPTMKLRRDHLVQKYQNEIALMYLAGKNVSDIYF